MFTYLVQIHTEADSIKHRGLIPESLLVTDA